MCFLEWVAGKEVLDVYYTDAGLQATRDPGYIAPEVLAYVRQVLKDAVADTGAIDRWFGRYVTEPKRAFIPVPSTDTYTSEEVIQALRQGQWLRRSAIAYFSHLQTNNSCYLYVCGQEFLLENDTQAAVSLLTGTALLDRATLRPYLANVAFVRLLAELASAGYLEWMILSDE